ncbi:MAG TPA: tRNA (N6-isopentenyl adenosine(37)-C2)-methylthiotransferase MiaB [Kiritimatiellia bacterium]|nr:tRNA (N6-isopentenyl adenosine(37)-C2)-methylthiotransferase MiaB [Kiritimatiellia bacterium]
MRRGRYHIWTIGCQMNEADSRQLAAQLEAIGYAPCEKAEEADLVILNTCVVRQQAENKIYSRLGSLQRLKQERPEMKIALMGCLVGVRGADEVKKRFPYVDVFLAPSETEPLIRFLGGHLDPEDSLQTDFHQVYTLPEQQRGRAVTAFVPAVLGCSHACSFCIIPSRRGPERSRPGEDVLEEIAALARQGVREVMLLGQIIDRYGLDLPGGPDLAGLLRKVARIEDVWRIRFLTSHPNWFTDRLIEAVAEEPKLCPQFEIAVQSGSDEVLERMRRGYDSARFIDLAAKVRRLIPDAAIHTDIIVGFPGETDAQYNETCELLKQLRLDKVHIAKYSPRPGTLAAKRYADDIPEDVKEQRRKHLDDIQVAIQKDQNRRLENTVVEVLAEDMDKNRWRGRTPQNRIVFFESPCDCLGKLVRVKIDWTGPFTMTGREVPA